MSDIYLHNNNINTTEISGNGTWQGANNIDANPKFIYAPNGDFHLYWNSPCAGAGIDSLEVNGTLFVCPVYDFDGNPRPLPSYTKPDIGAFEVDQTVGIDNIIVSPNSLIDVYPNPVRDYFYIELPESLQINNIQVFNIQGKLISDHRIPDVRGKIDVRELPEGFYILKVYTENGYVTGKMVKQ